MGKITFPSLLKKIVFNTSTPLFRCFFVMLPAFNATAVAKTTCANKGTVTFQDYDCDGVINSADLDDYNDGILDAQETGICNTTSFLNDIPILEEGYHATLIKTNDDWLITGEWLNGSGGGIITFQQLSTYYNIPAGRSVLNVTIGGNSNLIVLLNNGDFYTAGEDDFTSVLLHSSAVGQCANFGTSDNQDFDCDGVINSADLDDDNDGILDTEEKGSCIASNNNAGMEFPLITGSTPFLQTFIIPGVKTYDQNNVPFWSTTASNGAIEVWSSASGVPAHEGNQFFELNANEVSSNYQDLTTTHGSTVFWSIAHRGRDGIDVATVTISSVTNTSVVRTMTTGNTAWVLYSGTYCCTTAGQTTTRFEFRAVSSSNNFVLSVGNFLDSFSLSCNFDLDFVLYPLRFYPAEYVIRLN